MTEEEIQESTVEQTTPVDGEMHTGEIEAHVADGHVMQQEANPQEINWRKANEALASQKEENAALRGRLDAMQQMLQAQQQPKQEQKSYFDGRERDDYPNVSDVENFVKNEIGTTAGQFKRELQQLQLKAIDPNYMETIEKYQKHLPQHLKESIVKNSDNPWLAAYEAITSSAAYYRDQLSSQQHPDAKRVMDNSRKPQTLSGVSQSSSLSEASRYERMTDEEIIEMGNRYARGG